MTPESPIKYIMHGVNATLLKHRSGFAVAVVKVFLRTSSLSRTVSSLEINLNVEERQSSSACQKRPETLNITKNGLVARQCV